MASDCPASTITDKVTLKLVRKNPRTWQVSNVQTYALLSFSRQRSQFNCSGQHLESRQRYALIQHDESLPRGKGYIVAYATTDADGHIELTGEWQRWHGKVWLVVADDVQGMAGDDRVDHLIHWQPKRYLFESQPLL